MKKHCKIFLNIVLCFFIFSIAASAHSGKTDSSGGHYNRSTGEYHYHHGYPAHQHQNGKCPYEYDDQTSHSSGSSSVKEQPKEDVKTQPDDDSEDYLSAQIQEFFQRSEEQQRTDEMPALDTPEENVPDDASAIQESKASENDAATSKIEPEPIKKEADNTGAILFCIILFIIFTLLIMYGIVDAVKNRKRK